MTELDLALVADFFANKYDAVLVEVLRRLLSGLVTVAARVTRIEDKVYEAEHREELEKQKEFYGNIGGSTGVKKAVNAVLAVGRFVKAGNEHAAKTGADETGAEANE